MTGSRINVTKSSMPSIDEYMEEIRPMWESRWLSNRGEISIKFEEELKRYLSTDNLYLFANGHLALEVLINSLFMEGEVITTPYTHCSTIHAIVRNGLTPVFCDVMEEDYTINPDLIEPLITENTVAIVPTHVYGMLCDDNAISRIAKKYNLFVIYDAAHAFGVSRNGRNAANMGDAAMFSMHATKVFQTIEGGVACYRDAEKFKALPHLVNFGYTSQTDVDYIGTNARMNEFEAAMGICNLRHIDEEISKRKGVYERYCERLEGKSGIKLLRVPSNLKWNYAYFPVVFDGYRNNRDEMQQRLEKDEIYTRKYFYPIVNEERCYMEKYGNLNLPIAKHVSEHVLSLPMYADLELGDVDRICDIILENI